MKWEYKVCEQNGSAPDPAFLAAMGSESWELVSFRSEMGRNTCVFKRPVPVPKVVAGVSMAAAARFAVVHRVRIGAVIASTARASFTARPRAGVLLAAKATAVFTAKVKKN